MAPTCVTVAPAADSRSAVSSQACSTSGSMPGQWYSAGRPTRRPRTAPSPSPSLSVTLRRRSVTQVESSGSGADSRSDRTADRCAVSGGVGKSPLASRDSFEESERARDECDVPSPSHPKNRYSLHSLPSPYLFVSFRVSLIL